MTYRATGLFLLAFSCCLTCGIVAAEEGPASPGQLLKTEGKSEDWMKKTEKIRENLAKINPADPKVQKWMPAIKRRCITLQKLGKIGAVERDIFVKFFDAMLDDIVKGEKVLARYSGQTVNYGYWSKHINKLTGTKVQIPPDYDSDKEYQFFMYYKIGGGMYWYTPTKKWAGPHDEGAKVSGPHRPTAAMCQKAIPDTFQAWSALYYGVKGRMGLVEELKELTLAMSQDFSMSADRVFLSGYSDGGFSAMWLASHYPHLVAGIAPGVANWQFNNTSYFGFFNFATLVVDGWRDGGYLGENLARFTSLNNMGYDISGIVSHHGHQTAWLDDEATVKRIMAWAKTKRRDLNRKHIKYSTWNLAWNRAFWFSIERMENPSFAAVVDAKIEGNTIHVKAKNISAFKIDLNDKLVDMKSTLKILVNGKESYSGPCTEQVAVDLDAKWEAELTKNSTAHGGITVHAVLAEYFNKKSGHKKFKLPKEPWTWCAFTGGENAEAERKAIDPPKWAKPDTKVGDHDIKNNNIMCYGGPLRNKFVAQFADKLPIKFEKGKFTIGNKVYDEPEHWVKFLCPNPLNPKRDLLIFAFNDPIKRSKKGSMSLSPWAFRDGDCQVFGVKKSQQKYGLGAVASRGVDYYIFDSKYQAPDQTAIGIAEKTFDWQSVLKLKANAIREATKADIGMYDAPPGYNQWEKSIEKGPITINDVVVTHSLPEFIMTCDMTGKQLKAFLLPDKRGAIRAKITSAFYSKDAPGYDPETSLLVSDIKDDKTYKVAAGYQFCDGGSLSVSGSTDKMPKPFFFFNSVKEFVDHPGGRINHSNLMQTEIEVAEAVVEYIKKRKKVSPQPSNGDLTKYIANPELNLFGEYDWSHISLPYGFKEPKGSKVVSRAVTLGIGLRADDSTEGAENTKKLAELDVSKSGASLKLEMSALEKKLPVKIESSVAVWGLEGDSADLTTIKLTDAEAAKSGSVSLLKVTITNGGDKKLSGLQTLGNSSMTRIHGGTWGGKGEKGKPAPYFYGYLRNIGPRKKPYAQDGAFFVYEGSRPKYNNLVIPSGYNNGLIGFNTGITIEPKSSTVIGMLFINIAAKDLKKPKLNMQGVLETIKPKIMEELKK